MIVINKWLLFLDKSEDDVGQNLEYESHDGEGKHIIPQPVNLIAKDTQLSEAIKGANIAAFYKIADSMIDQGVV